ncbi:MAG: NAD(P)-dependent oxidoreductase [Rhodospirillales bacterium]|nr:MAG: NAD(P)-dependent oxidoreductase [Rhodospirillales bacterium]
MAQRDIAFIGLGVMGFPMAGHLAAAGHRVRVFNRTPAKAEAWAERHPGRVAASPAEACAGADLAFICVGNDQDVRSVVLGDAGALAGLASGAVLVDHTTTSAHLARDLAAMAVQSDVAFLDAPVSGGQAGAEHGRLTIMVGGEPAAFHRAEPVMAAYARAVTRMGAAGAGQLTKMVNQICIAGLLQSLAEGLSFAEAAGLDVDQVVSVIAQGAAQSWQMDNRANSMLEDRFDFGFAVDWMRKDLAICLEEARASGASIPVAALVDQFFAEVQQMGGGRWDTSSLIRRLRRPADGGDPISSSP